MPAGAAHDEVSKVDNNRSEGVMAHCCPPPLKDALVSRYTSSFTCQPILLNIPTLSIHDPSLLHSFTLGSNLPFNKSFPPQQTSSTHWTAFMLMRLDRTYHALQFSFSFSFYFFCLFREVD